MNKNYFLLFLLSPFTFGQVGVNTDDPQATMEIKARTPSGTSTETDGIIIPNITRERAQNMENPSESTLIYISEATSGTANGKAIDIDEKGYYYYNGTKWVKLTTWDNINGTTHTFTNAIAHDQTTNLVKLGGNLIEPTTITTDNINTLAIAGLQNGNTTTEKVLTVDTNGVIKSATIDLNANTVTANSGLTKIEQNITLGGILNNPTTITTDNVNTLAIAGLQNGNTTTEKVLTVDTNGIIKSATIDLSNITVPLQVKYSSVNTSTTSLNLKRGTYLINTSYSFQFQNDSEGGTEFYSSLNISGNNTIVLYNYTGGSGSLDRRNYTSGTALINVTADTTVNFSINPGDNNQNRILSYSLNVLATPAIVNNNL